MDLGALPQTRTAVMVNIASPSAAFQWWRLPAAGVGLARMEFIISNLIRIHPMALVHPERVTDFGEAARMLVDHLHDLAWYRQTHSAILPQDS